MVSLHNYTTTVFQICVGSFIILANSASIHVLRRTMLGLSKITVFLLINLALADLMLGATLATRGVLLMSGTTSFRGCLTLMSILGASGVIIFCTSIITSVYNLYNCQGKLRNVKKNYTVIVTLQTVSWILSFVVGFILSVSPNHVPITACSVTDDMIDRKSLLFVATWWLVLVVSLSTLQVCTAIKLKKIQNTTVGPLEQNASGLSSSTGAQGIQTNHAKTFRKSIVLFTFVAGLNIVCWLPFLLSVIMKAVLSETMAVNKILPYLAAICFSCSVMNFFIYLIRMKRFRAALWKTVTCTN